MRQRWLRAGNLKPPPPNQPPSTTPVTGTLAPPPIANFLLRLPLHSPPHPFLPRCSTSLGSLICHANTCIPISFHTLPLHQYYLTCLRRNSTCLMPRWRNAWVPQRVAPLQPLPLTTLVLSLQLSSISLTSVGTRTAAQQPLPLSPRAMKRTNQ